MDTIDKANYFGSLIKMSTEQGIISESTANALTLQFSERLATMCKAFMSEGSTSIRVEIAEDLFSSMMYSLNYYFNTNNNAETAIEAFQTLSFNEIYDKSLKSIDALKRKITHFHHLIIETRIPTDNFNYNLTVDIEIKKAIAAFYRANYFPHEPVLFSYRVSHEETDDVGMTYIFDYCKKLLTENKLCRLFLGEGGNKSLLSVEDEQCNLFDMCLKQLLLDKAFNMFTPAFLNAGHGEVEAFASELSRRIQEQSKLSDFYTDYTRVALCRIIREMIAFGRVRAES